ncbi:lysine N(6)-hydroxylase/L-ornithine N(5)-oxygenase family protein [Halobacillus shinanisalinarum]|uniref:L-lysine N6-monooxygenase MbtG n=1 Tax=Halobacillus shinanisalinarum TaxID=2932258 RepID=A0ABY4H1Z8_9BACI|nr:lysine N(6)-hydroxylase/L-ornithine N(5)-oxygenase family protein [Halobacillus shinanisalinarum]UOQ94306.1 lysine N(6)-hydroxylase/L-ornithine N(5)-oxygenase family protein [Halobacillus shinanisalinarum]
MSTHEKDQEQHIYDVIGIGLGPFNLGLAALLDDIDEMNGIFLDKKQEFDWHPGMMIEGTTLQVPFFADLVSMANVKSEYSFLNYLQRHGRLYHFYFLEKFHISRKEYNHYCRWVSNQLNRCKFNMDVQSVHQLQLDDGEEVYEVHVENLIQQRNERLLTRNLVVGIGSVPAVPANLEKNVGDTVFHTSDYLAKKEEVSKADSITVVGSGQSAAEVFLDLLKERGEEAELHWYTRSKGFFPMEYSKLGLEYFSPDYTNFFYKLPQQKKDTLLKDQDLLYKGISTETISELYDCLYEGTVGNESLDVHLQAMSEIMSIDEGGSRWRMRGSHFVTGEDFEHESNVIILGTGYKTAVPQFLSPISHLINWDDQGRYQVEQDYKVSSDHKIFVQNAEMHTHGVGAPDLGLGAYRNAVIINSITGREVFPLDDQNVFQTFGTVKQHRKKGYHVIQG